VPDSARKLIRPAIQNDWLSMRELGVDAHGADPTFVDDLWWRQQNPALLRVQEATRGYLRRLGEPELMLVVCDAEGCVIWRDGDPRMVAEAAWHGFDLGSKWAENSTGTGGIKLIANPTGARPRAVHVCGAEHWVGFQHKWACTAAAVRNLHTGGLLGVVNVTTHWRLARRHPVHGLTALVNSIYRTLSVPLYRELAILRAAAQHR
jgi:transcriptional regulator of acetoin/glycerol metabolism